jgi:hypothetical protein
MKAAAFCLLDENPWHFGERLKNSFEYFHKDIPFYLCHPNHMKDIIGPTYNWPKRNGVDLHLNAARIEMLLQLKKAYEYDIIMMFDADVVVTSYLDEFLSTDYDIAGSLNVERFPGDKFMNMGVTSVANNSFIELWADKMKDDHYMNTYGNEQEIMNVLCGTLGRDNHIFAKRPWKVKAVDKNNVYYNERSRNYWGEISIRNDQMYCNGRQLKVMHWAGGTGFGARWSCKVFSQETRLHLNKITNTTDFTDHEGADAGWFHH